MEKAYIWTLPTRVFHVLFALFVTLSFLIEDDELLSFHVSFGYIVFLLILFRTIWGFFGPQYSKFKDFPISKVAIKEFVLNILEPKHNYIGHHPLASIVMILMIVSLLITTITGALVFGVEESRGIFSFLGNSSTAGFFEDFHEFFANLSMFLIFLHLAGIFMDRLLHKQHRTLESIVDGYKIIEAKEYITLNLFQKLLAMIFLTFFIGLVASLVFSPNSFLL